MFCTHEIFTFECFGGQETLSLENWAWWYAHHMIKFYAITLSTIMVSLAIREITLKKIVNRCETR